MITKQPRSESANWYLRTLGDADTHRGAMAPNGTVRAVCGAIFAPRPLALGGYALPGNPPDPKQACPACHKGAATR